MAKVNPPQDPNADSNDAPPTPADEQPVPLWASAALVEQQSVALDSITETLYALCVGVWGADSVHARKVAALIEERNK